MKSEKLLGEDFLEMQKEKGKICISIIVPTHRLSPERQTDALTVKKAMDKAKEFLRFKYSAHEIPPLMQSMNELFESIDFNHNADGLGFYISPAFKSVVKFPFPVKEKVMVGDNFEIRDVLYKMNYSLPYLILMLTEKGGRLFEGSWDNLSEIKDNEFPMEYTDDYVYSKPIRSSSYAGHSHVKIFEKDKSELESIRFRDFFKKLDKVLESYIAKEMPLIVLGAAKEMSLFSGVTHHRKNIIAKVTGSYNYANEKELADLTWPSMHLYLENKWKNLVKEFEEKIGEGLGVTGIQEIWNAVQEGKGYKLLVEKDYRCPGFLVRNDYQLYLHPPKNPHKVLADAVDDLIEKLIEKNGHVFFVENGMLKNNNRIALITRY